MTITFTWESLIALCGLATLVFGGLVALTRMMINTSLLEFEHRFFERLNGRYIKAELCEARHRETDRRLAAIKG